MFVQHVGFALGKHPVPEAGFPYQEGNRDVPAAQHFRHFDPDKTAAHNDCAAAGFLVRGVLFQQFQVLIGIQPLYSGQVLSGPTKLVGAGTRGQDEFVVPDFAPVFQV